MFSIFGPKAPFGEYHVTTSCERQLEIITIAHLTCLLYKISTETVAISFLDFIMISMTEQKNFVITKLVLQLVLSIFSKGICGFAEHHQNAFC